jgi:F-type H+-transporting ATPase subunit b
MHDFFTSNLANFVWGLAAFGVFAVVLFAWAAKGIIRAVDARDERIRKQIEDAERVNGEARKLQAELTRKVRECEDQVSQAMAKARAEAEQVKDALIEKGRVEVEGLRLRAQQDIEAARHAAIVSLRAEVASIAIEVAAKIIAAKLDDGRQDELVRQAIDSYESAGKR